MQRRSPILGLPLSTAARGVPRVQGGSPWPETWDDARVVPLLQHGHERLVVAAGEAGAAEELPAPSEHGNEGTPGVSRGLRAFW